MTTPTLTQASPPTAAPVVDFEALLALRLAEMDGRCRTAVLAVDINSAHIAVETPEITAPLRLTPTLAPNPYTTPMADLLQRARRRMVADGWCRDAIFDDQGAVCPIRAIRLEAHGDRRLADDACVLLLDAIQQHWQAETIPSWNARQTSIAPVLLAFDRAADLAHACGR
ncbi:hypothetical protein ABT119_06080 [Streptomyces sp. NPDC001910]|uniref:DUF6197 family protein n=1 Tax=Streptomyces sp. NPDC001910 TaxID=3154403 RepID=UPI00331D97A8